MRFEVTGKIPRKQNRRGRLTVEAESPEDAVAKAREKGLFADSVKPLDDDQPEKEEDDRPDEPDENQRFELPDLAGFPSDWSTPPDDRASSEPTDEQVHPALRAAQLREKKRSVMAVISSVFFQCLTAIGHVVLYLAVAVGILVAIGMWYQATKYDPTGSGHRFRDDNAMAASANAVEYMAMSRATSGDWAIAGLIFWQVILLGRLNRVLQEIKQHVTAAEGSS